MQIHAGSIKAPYAAELAQRCLGGQRKVAAIALIKNLAHSLRLGQNFLNEAEETL